jgi:hypothetical protein
VLFNSIVNTGKQTPHLCTFDRDFIKQLLGVEGFKIIRLENKNKKLDLVVVAKKVNKKYLWR